MIEIYTPLIELLKNILLAIFRGFYNFLIKWD